MIDLVISGYRNVEMKGKNRFVVATTFGDAEVIIFSRIPEESCEYVERHIENVITHETIHIVISRLVGERAGVRFDRLNGINGWYPRVLAKVGKG